MGFIKYKRFVVTGICRQIQRAKRSPKKLRLYLATSVEVTTNQSLARPIIYCSISFYCAIQGHNEDSKKNLKIYDHTHDRSKSPIS